MTATVDPSVTYNGPRAEFASLTGSPFWGLSIQEIIGVFQHRGWQLRMSERLPTPYGLGPLMTHFMTPGGRSVIWIPSYGMIQDQEVFTLEMTRRAFWLLWKAGIKVLLIGGTSGTADWRDPEAEDTVRPGDFVLPWSFYRSGPFPGTMPGTDMATGFLPRVALMADPFCVALRDNLRIAITEKYVPARIRRVHDASTVRVIIHPPKGVGSFETEGEVLVWRVLTKIISSDVGFPYVTIFGDCISPVLARQMGIHLAYYHIPSNWAQGNRADRDKLKSLDQLYLKVLPQLCLDLEINSLEAWDIPERCTCDDYLIRRPSVYLESLSPAAPS